MPIVAFCQRSFDPTSDTDTLLNLDFILWIRLFRVCLLALRDLLPFIYRSMRSMPITIYLRLELLLKMFMRVELERVADFDVVEPFDADTALISGVYLFHVVFEPLQGCELAFEDHDPVPDHPHAVIPRDLSVRDHTTRDSAYTRYGERLPDFGVSRNLFLDYRLEEAFHGAPDPVDELVDNGVELERHTLPLGYLKGVGVGSYIEADYYRIGCARERDVRFVYRADTGMNDLDLTFFGAEFADRFVNGFNGPLCVRLDNQRKLLRFFLLEALEQIFEGRFPFLCRSGFPLLHLPVADYFLCRPFVLYDIDQVPGLRHARETHYLYRHRRTGLVYPSAFIVD